MKKFNKKSLAVVGLALSLSAAALTGCSTDELEAKIDENASNAEVAVSDAVTKAADDLAAAKSALEAAIQSGDTANTEALTKAISDLNAAIEEAKNAATTGDGTLDAAIKAAEKTADDAVKALQGQIKTLEEDLNAKITALQTALSAAESGAATKAELEAKVTEMTTALGTLQSALTSAQTALEKADTDNKTELNKAIEDAKKALEDSIKALETKIGTLKIDLETAIKNGDDGLDGKITALSTLLSTTEEALKGADAANKAELNKAIEDAKKALEDSIKALETSLTTKIDGLNADLAKKYSDLNMALEALKTGAATKDELKELATKAEDLSNQIKALETELKAEQKKLSDDIAGAKTALEAADEALGGRIEGIDTTIKTLTANLQGLSDIVTGLNSDLNDALNNELKNYISKNDWNGTTELLIPIVNELGTAKAEALVHAGSTVKLAAKVETTYTEAYVRIIRALDETVAKGALADAKEIFDGVKDLTGIYNSVDQNDYDKDGKEALEKAWNEAVDRFDKLNTEEGKGDTIDKIKEDLEAALAAVMPKKLADVANELADAIKVLREKLAAEGDLAFNRENWAEFERIVNKVESYKDNVAHETFLAVINKKTDEADEKGQYELLQDEWAAAKKVFDDAVADLLGKLDAANANGSKFLYNEKNWNEIVGLNEAVTKFLAETEAARGFTVKDTDAHDIFKAISDFRTGVYQRATQLNTAATNAGIINTQIKAFTDQVKKVSRITAYYPENKDSIDGMVKEWDDTNFSSPYDDETDPESDYYSNYELIDRKAYNDLLELYDENIGKFIKAVDAAADAIVGVKYVDEDRKIERELTLLDEGIVSEAQKVFDATWSLLQLGKKEISLSATEKAGPVYGYLSFEAMRGDMEALHNKIAALKSTAAKDYKALTLLNGEMVTVYSKPEVDALAGWFKTYLGVDITDEDATWTLGEYNLGECTVDEKAFEKACSIYDDYKTLVDAKTALEKKITDKIAALFADHDGKACTSQRLLIGEIKLLCDNWLSGAYGPVLELVDVATATAEEGSSTTTTPAKQPRFVAEQLQAILTREAELKALIDALDARDVAVEQLEEDREDLYKRVEALKDLSLKTADERDGAKKVIAKIYDDIDAWVEKNVGHDCFTGDCWGGKYECYTALKQAEFALYYGEAMEQIGYISDEKHAMIKSDLTKRANELKKAVDEAIEGNVKVDLTVDIERMALIAYTAEQCVAVQDDPEVEEKLYGKYMVVAAEMGITADDYKIGEDGKVDMESLNEIVSYKKNNIKLTINP